MTSKTMEVAVVALIVIAIAVAAYSGLGKRLIDSAKPPEIKAAKISL